MPENDDILDPAHEPENPGSMGAAGIPGKEPAKNEPPDFKASDDGNIVEHGGRKYVNEAALHEARERNRQLTDTLARLDPVMPEFEEFLKTRDNRRQATTARAAAGGDQDEKEYLEEVATAMGFYDEQNQPDLRKAQAHLNITRREADRIAERRVKPYADGNTRDRAETNRQRARSARFVDGQPIAGDQYLDAALKALPDDYIADPNIANITQVIAAGLEYLDKRKNGEFQRGGGRNVGRREPMHVERGSGRVSDDFDGGLSDLDLAAARSRGKSPEEWAKLANKVNPSRGGSGRRGDTVSFEDA